MPSRCMKTFDHLQAAFPGQRPGAEHRRPGQGRQRPRRAGRHRRLPAAGPRLRSGRSSRSTDARSAATAACWSCPCRCVGDGSDTASQAAVRRLRATSSRPRSAPSRRHGATSTAQAAQTMDGNDNLASHAPLVFGFVLTMAFLLLLVTFRSIVIPIKAIMLNLLSGRGRLRRADAGLPARPRRGHRHAAHDRHRLVAARVPVRDPVRPLDGLPRVHHQPHQGGLGQGPRQREGRRAGHPQLRRRRHRRRRR